MIIFLIGFMGSGKTTLGKRLAKKIGYAFMDMDEQIEQNEQMTVSEIFRKKGEEYFRNMEINLLNSLNNEENLVIATGGGTPCFGNNMEIMNSKGVTIYLKVSPECLIERLEKGRNNRPLIANMEGDELLHFINNRLTDREQFYMKARCVIKSENATPDNVISLVL